jgi:hypothetical protein
MHVKKKKKKKGKPPLSRSWRGWTNCLPVQSPTLLLPTTLLGTGTEEEEEER